MIVYFTKATIKTNKTIKQSKQFGLCEKGRS